jgi:tetratricopeptide (TPR) repeat protein
MHRVIPLSMAILLCGVVGCGGGAVSQGSRAQTYVSLTDAEAALAAGDFPKAEVGFTSAIDSGSLQPDNLGDAYIRRALARIGQSKLPEAEADIAKAEQAAASPSLRHLAACELALKKGDAATAKAEFAKAVALDPTLKKPAGL